MPTRRYSFSAPSELQSSMPLRLSRRDACSAAADFHTSTSQHLHRASTDPEVHTSTSLRLKRASRASELHTSTSTHLQRASTFHNSIYPSSQVRNAPLDL